MEYKGRILIVDDEEAILKILSIKLKVSGYEVLTASDGEAGLHLIRSEKPDVVLLDVILPKLTGLQVLEKLGRRKKIPVIVFSARAENAQKAMYLGASDFIDKPFDIDVLIRRIAKLLNHKTK